MKLRRRTPRKATFLMYEDEYTGFQQVVYVKEGEYCFHLQEYRRDRADGDFYRDGDSTMLGKGFLRCLIQQFPDVLAYGNEGGEVE